MADLQNNDSTVADFVVSRLINYNNSAEGGKSLPPRQRGSSRVPSVNSLRISKTQQQSAGTVFTLEWQEPQDDPSQPIDHYNIYVTKYLDNNSSPVGLFSVQHSPATIYVPADGQTPVAFSIQTVLKNGTTSALEISPTTSGIATLPSISVADGSITTAKLADGAVTTVKIADASLTLLKFFTNLLPIQVVTTLPSQPVAQGTVVFLTSDNLLYRSTGSAWTKAVSAADISGTLTGSQIANGAIDLTKFGSGLQPVQVVATLPTYNALTYPQGTIVFNQADNKLYRATGSAWTTAIANADIPTGTISGDRLVANTLTAGQIAAGTITGNEIAANTIAAAKIVSGTLTSNEIAANTITGGNIAAATITGNKISAGAITAGLIAAGAVTSSAISAAAIDATKLNIRQIIVVGMTLTNNSPSVGQVAWSSCIVYWNGTTYAISSGSAAATELFIYWDAGNTTFTPSPAFTSQINRFPIATNTQGIADEAWNKLASQSIQEDNLAFALLQGFQIQPITVVGSIGIATFGVYSILNLTPPKGGVLLNVGVVNSFGGSVANPSGTTLSIAVDGATAETLLLYPDGVPFFDTGSRVISAKSQGNGGTTGDFMNFSFNLGFQTSLLVKIDVAGGHSDGQIDVYALYALRV